MKQTASERLREMASKYEYLASEMEQMADAEVRRGEGDPPALRLEAHRSREIAAAFRLEAAHSERIEDAPADDEPIDLAVAIELMSAAWSDQLLRALREVFPNRRHHVWRSADNHVGAYLDLETCAELVTLLDTAQAVAAADAASSIAIADPDGDPAPLYTNMGE